MSKQTNKSRISMLPNGDRRFDALIVFGHGPVGPSRVSSLGKLPPYGRIIALAAGMLYNLRKIRAVIPTGGRTGGTDKASEAYLIARFILSRFEIDESTFILEEQATNTILNVAYSANIIDKLPNQNNQLIFLSMGFHLPRIKEICSLIGLTGYYLSAETILSMRSRRHSQLLSNLLSPNDERYRSALDDQPRWYRALIEIPEYWLPQIAVIENPTRLRKILKTDRIQMFLRNSGIIDVDSYSTEDLRMWLNSVPRKFPSAQ